jgi:hypothetical protein
MLIDLHIHTPSTRGCELQPKQVVAKAASLGLDGVVFADLNTIDGCEELLALGKDVGVKVFVGVLLATDHGRYLAFFPDPAQVPDPVQMFGENKTKGWPAREVLERVQALGGVAVAAHPYDRDIDRPSGDYIFTLKDKLVAVEGINGRRKPGVNDLAVEAAEHLGLPCIGASGAVELAEVGKAATFFKRPVTTHAELVAALKSRDFFAVGAGKPAPLSELARAPKQAAGGPFDRTDRGERDRGGRPGGDRGERRNKGGGDRRGGRDRRGKR